VGGEPESLATLARAVHNFVAPLATGFFLQLGFRGMWVACNDECSVCEEKKAEDTNGPRTWLRPSRCCERKSDR